MRILRLGAVVAWLLVAALLPQAGVLHTSYGPPSPASYRDLAVHLQEGAPGLPLAPALTNTTTPICSSSLGSTLDSMTITVPRGNSCDWTNATFQPGVSGFGNTPTGVVFDYLTIQGGGIVRVNASWTLVASGVLTVDDGSSLIFSMSDKLELYGKYSGITVLTNSVVLLNGTSIQSDPGGGGEVFVDHGVLYGSRISSSTLPPGAAVGSFNFTGRLSSFTVRDTSLAWINTTGALGGVNLTGSSSSFPMSISHLNTSNSSISEFFADNATISDVTLGVVGNITLGNATAKLSDYVSVESMQVTSEVSGTIALAHAVLVNFRVSGAANVAITNSTLHASASNVTNVASSFVATSGSTFEFPLIFGSTGQVRLQNVTAPGLYLNGNTYATLYNWAVNTALNPNTPSVGVIPGIRVLNANASVQIYRYVTIHVEGSNGGVPPPNTRFSILGSSASSKWMYYPLPATGVLGLFLPTDNVTQSEDFFTGDYSLKASVGSEVAAYSLVLNSSNLAVILQIAPVSPAFPISMTYVFYAEIGLLVTVVAATVYVTNRTRRLRKGRALVSKETTVPNP